MWIENIEGSAILIGIGISIFVFLASKKDFLSKFRNMILLSVLFVVVTFSIIFSDDNFRANEFEALFGWIGISSLFLLFLTVSHMTKTPLGRGNSYSEIKEIIFGDDPRVHLKFFIVLSYCVALVCIFCAFIAHLLASKI